MNRFFYQVCNLGRRQFGNVVLIDTGVDDTGFKMPLALLTTVAICACFLKIGGKLPPVLFILVANLPPL
jgi:hypothetical protein